MSRQQLSPEQQTQSAQERLSLKDIGHLFARLSQQEVEQFHQGYQLWTYQQQIADLNSRLGLLQQEIELNSEQMRQYQPSSIALAALAQLQASGVEDIALLDTMLMRGDTWLDHTMELLTRCEELDMIRGDYTEWCQHALEGAYEWINTMDEVAANQSDVETPAASENAEITELIDIPLLEDVTEEILLQKLMSDTDKLPISSLTAPSISAPEAALLPIDAGENTNSEITSSANVIETHNDEAVSSAIDRTEREDPALIVAITTPDNTNSAPLSELAPEETTSEEMPFPTDIIEPDLAHAITAPLTDSVEVTPTDAPPAIVHEITADATELITPVAEPESSVIATTAETTSETTELIPADDTDTDEDPTNDTTPPATEIIELTADDENPATEPTDDTTSSSTIEDTDLASDLILPPAVESIAPTTSSQNTPTIDSVESPEDEATSSPTTFALVNDEQTLATEDTTAPDTDLHLLDETIVVEDTANSDSEEQIPDAQPLSTLSDTHVETVETLTPEEQPSSDIQVSEADTHTSDSAPPARAETSINVPISTMAEAFIVETPQLDQQDIIALQPDPDIEPLATNPIFTHTTETTETREKTAPSNQPDSKPITTPLIATNPSTRARSTMAEAFIIETPQHSEPSHPLFETDPTQAEVPPTTPEPTAQTDNVQGSITAITNTDQTMPRIHIPLQDDTATTVSEATTDTTSNDNNTADETLPHQNVPSMLNPAELTAIVNTPTQPLTHDLPPSAQENPDDEDHDQSEIDPTLIVPQDQFASVPATTEPPTTDAPVPTAAPQDQDQPEDSQQPEQEPTLQTETTTDLQTDDLPQQKKTDADTSHNDQGFIQRSLSKIWHR